jgi:hypothetical protein
VNAAEGREVAEVREVKGSDEATPPKSMQDDIRGKLKELRKHIAPEDETHGRASIKIQNEAPQDVKQTLNEMKSILKQIQEALPPQLLQLVSSQAQAAYQRLQQIERQQDGRRGDITTELKGLFSQIENISEMSQVKPGDLNLGETRTQTELRTPQNAIERNIQTRVEGRFSDIAEVVFGDIDLDVDNKADLRMDLRAQLVDKALNNQKFQDAFLSNDRDIRKLVRDKLKADIKTSLAPARSEGGELDTQSLAGDIVNQLENQIASRQEGGRDRGERRMQK